MNYTIVGVIKRPTWEPTWSPGYTAISYVDESMIGATEKTTATVVLKRWTAPYTSMQRNWQKKIRSSRSLIIIVCSAIMV